MKDALSKKDEEHEKLIVEKDEQIRQLRGSKGKIQLMFALSIKVRQMFQKEFLLQKEQAAAREQELRAQGAQAVQNNVADEMAGYF